MLVRALYPLLGPEHVLQSETSFRQFRSTGVKIWSESILVPTCEPLVGVFQKFLRGIVKELLSPSPIEDVSHAQVLQSVAVNLLACLHEASCHRGEGFEAGRTSHLATSNCLLSELVVKPKRGFHRLAYGQINFLFKLKLRFQIRLDVSMWILSLSDPLHLDTRPASKCCPSSLIESVNGARFKRSANSQRLLLRFGGYYRLNASSRGSSVLDCFRSVP